MLIITVLIDLPKKRKNAVPELLQRSVEDMEELCERGLKTRISPFAYGEKPLHDNVWFKSTGDLCVSKVKYGHLWGYSHLPPGWQANVIDTGYPQVMGSIWID